MNLLILGMPEKIPESLLDSVSFLKGKKLLLATSGGIDSMVMVHLFLEQKFDVAIAHCNFQLRGIESFDDQKFIENFAQKNNIPVFITQFDTKAFAEDYKLSTQVAARELRYNWFYELLETENYDFILTAHHADDNLETFLINLSRGTGIEGLTGIPHQNEKVIRPLLDFSRKEIEDYAKANHIEWREDSSNASDKYLRNKIRHGLVPILKELHPEFLTAFQKTQNYLQQTQAMAEDASIMVYQQVAQEANDEIHFNIKKLKQLPNYHSYLYQWLREFGFSAWEDIYALADGQSGKQVYAPQYRLLKNREFLILSPLLPQSETHDYQIENDSTQIKIPLKLSLKKVNAISDASNNVIFVDAQKIKFPLVLRKWHEGDSFRPFGMDGKSKKVSKHFKDEKLSVIEKEKVWLLLSEGEIIWVVGSRQDERFKVTNTTKHIIQITVTQ